MLVPDKFTALSESMLGKLAGVFHQINGKVSLINLYQHIISGEGKVKITIEEFIYAVEILYLLSLVEIDLPTGVVTRAY